MTLIFKADSVRAIHLAIEFPCPTIPPTSPKLVKCFNDNADAVAICAHCGKALCRDCAQTRADGRMICSSNCGEALTIAEQVVQSILKRSAQSAKANALYCYVSGGLSAAAAVVAHFMLPSPYLILFASGCAVVLIASGIWHTLSAR